jgi:hypothetical protein
MKTFAAPENPSDPFNALPRGKDLQPEILEKAVVRD